MIRAQNSSRELVRGNSVSITLATAWSKQHDFVASTIVGATRFDQLADIFAASDLVLEPAVMKAIDAVTREIMYPMG